MGKNTPWTREDVDDFIGRLVAMKSQAMDMGLYKTGHALEPAVTKVGYELEEIMSGKHPTSIDEDGNMIIVGKVKPG